MYNGGESTRTAAPVFKKICDSICYVMDAEDDVKKENTE